MTVVEFALVCLTWCDLFEASETSGKRTRRRNLQEQGVTHSAHLVGLGRDVSYDVPPTRVEREEWAERLGLTVVFADSHDHLQPKGWKPG